MNSEDVSADTPKKEFKFCGAKLRKRPGKTCKKLPMKGKRRCRLHGGKSLGGFASPTFKHGRYSDILPKDMRKRYEQARKDPELLSHEPELRLIDSHLHELLKQAELAGSPKTLLKAQKAWEDFLLARTKDNEAMCSACLDEVGLALTDKTYDPLAWIEIREVMEGRRKILESETRRIKDKDMSMGAEQLLAIIEFIVDIIRQSVLKYADAITSQQILSQVTTNIGTLVSRPNQAQARTTRIISE